MTRDVCEGMILNFTSHARGDFYVETVRTSLGDNQIIIPQTAGIDSRGIIAENRHGPALPLGILVATVEHIATDFTAWNTFASTSAGCPLETCVSKGR